MILCADARALPLKDESVQMCVTSPPYWSLRQYQVEGYQIGQEKTPEEYVSVSSSGASRFTSTWAITTWRRGV